MSLYVSCGKSLYRPMLTKKGKFRLTTNYQYKAQQKWLKVGLKHFSIVGLMSPGWVWTQVRTHSDFCWTRGLGLGLWLTGLGLGHGLWSNGLGLGLWSNGLGLAPDGLRLGFGLWPCGLGLTAGLTSPGSLQHWIKIAETRADTSTSHGSTITKIPGLLGMSTTYDQWVSWNFWKKYWKFWKESSHGLLEI